MDQRRENRNLDGTEGPAARVPRYSISPDPSDDSVTVTRASKRYNADVDDETVSRQEGSGQRSPAAFAETPPSAMEPHSSASETGSTQDQNQAESAEDDNSEITVVSRKPPHSVHGNPATSKQLGELLLGKQLGTFRLDSFLGSGGMGAVFQATDTQLHRQVAVKVLKSTDGDADAVRRFRTEAQSAARLDHENIARVYHVGQDQGWNFIVLELVAGKTLRQLVAEAGPLTFDVALDFFQQLSAALQHAHHRQIIHRDIKPSNVLITPDQKVKLVDMGLARIVSSERQPDETEDGMTLGTFDYIAPEQARDPKSADQQSDLYSLGCTLFFALTGRPPFAGGNAIEKILNHNSAARPNVCDFRSDLPPAANLLITRLMAPNKVDRIASADEFGEALKYLRRPKIQPTTGLDQQPVGLRVPMLLAIAATVVFVLTSLFDQSPVTSSVAFPTIPGLETASEDSNGANTTGSDAKPADTPAMTSEKNGELSDETESNDGGLNSYDLGIQPWLLRGSSGANGQPETESWAPSFGLSDWGIGGVETKSSTRSEQQPVGVLAPDRTSEGTGSNGSKVDKSRTFSEPPSDDVLAQTTTIQVRPQERRSFSTPATSPRPNTLVYGSLADAISSLDQLYNVHTIELCFDGPHACDPMEIQSSVLRTVKAGDGYRPTLRFPASSEDNVDGLVTISSGSLEFSGIDWVVENPLDRPLSLFDFPKMSQLSVSDCSFTLMSPRTLKSDCTWVDTNTSQLVSGLRQTQAIVNFNDCVIRGDASLLRMENFSAIGINLVNVWMVTGSSIFDFGSVPEDSLESSAEIDIQRSSLISAKGLAVCDATGNRKHGQLLVHSKRSLLAVDGSASLFRHIGKVQWKPAAMPLYFDGSQNRIAATTVWMIESDANFLNRSYSITSASGQLWFKQKDLSDWTDQFLTESGERYQNKTITGMSSQMDWTFLPDSIVTRQNDSESIGANAASLPVFPESTERKSP